MLEWIAAVVQLCQSAVATGKTLIEWKESLLSERERDLLLSAAKDGIFYLSRSDRHGRFVWSHGKQFVDDDPAVTAHYLDAFLKLCSRGLIIHQHNECFRLTGTGFDIARGLVVTIDANTAALIRDH